eukprot:m.29786 g.29786  ORF g.29786 m.29786 type:complete len:397 (-) comp6182_c0_seq1:117-1307(-)
MSEEVYHFDPSHVYKTERLNILGRLPTFSLLFEVLWKYANVIEWLWYLPTLLHMAMTSTFISIFTIIEKFYYKEKIAAAKQNMRPVFILGHNRSGTTLTHNLLSTNTMDFAFPALVDVAMPTSSFLSIIARLREKNKNQSNKRLRPMDNMELGEHLPQEEEFAINMLSGGLSAYSCFSFPLQYKEIIVNYMNSDNFTPVERKRYMAAVDQFYQRMAFLHPGKRMIYKSPTHTSKIKLFLSMYPDAQFVFLHRNPYRVFISMCHLADRFFWCSHLNTPTSEMLLDLVLTFYEEMMKTYLETRHLIKKENLIEISFDELQNDKIGTMKKIYDGLGWEGFETTRPQLEAYVKKISSFEKNSFVQLTNRQRDVVNERWKFAFDAFGYEMVHDGVVDVSTH